MLYICFFFNDTATTEIYTYDTLFPYTTLFRSSRRHPCDLSGGGAVSRPVARRRRRAAPLRRRAAADADRQGRAPAAPPRDDRDPDPAHPATRQPRRDGRVADRRDAAGAHAGRYARRLGRPAR